MADAVSGPVSPGPAASPGRRLVLVRHGRTAWNHERRAQGHTDVGLDPVGHVQARAAAPVLASYRPAALWSSDLARAAETVAYLAAETGLSVLYDARLREYDVGLRAGLTLTEFAERHPDVFDAWRREGGAAVPGAETDADVVARVVPALRDLLASLGPGETGMAVMHGGCLKAGLIVLLDLPLAVAPVVRGVDNCGWIVIEEAYDGGPLRLVALNQVAHPGDRAPDFAPEAAAR